MHRPRTDHWWRPFRKIDGIAVEHVDLTPSVDFEAEAYVWLDDEEKIRLEKFMFPGPKRRFALCRAALRRILCDRLRCANDELSFAESFHGKPSALVKGRAVPVSFNVSHSGSHGLLAFAPSGRIGVDIEERVANRNLELLARTVLGPNEFQEIEAIHGEQKIEMFFNLWTVKEALIKALGVGISLDTSKFEVPYLMRRGAKRSLFEFPHKPGTTWQIEDLSNHQFAAALAYELPPEA